MGLTDFFDRRQFARFVLVGALNTAVAYAVYAALLLLDLHYTAASLGSLALSVVTGFLMHGRFVFGNTEPQRFWRYLLAWALLYLINIVLIWVFVRLGSNTYLAGALAMPLVVGASFAIQKMLIFRDASPRFLIWRPAYTRPERNTEK